MKAKFKSIISTIVLLSLAVLVTFTGCNKPSGGSNVLTDGGLRIGWGRADFTPQGKVILWGQYYDRTSQYVESPLMVTACAIESAKTDSTKEQAIMVSFDLVNITQWMQDSLRNRVRKQLPGFDPMKLFLNATHTHSATDPDAMQYRKLYLDKADEAIVQAWNSRQPAGISRQLGYAVTGHNRRAEYANGLTEMYGKTDRDDYTGMEGGNNSGVDMLFCWDLNKKLTGIIMNVTCPAQVTEAKYYVSSDYWGELRKEIAQKFPGNVYILTQCGAAGDLSPRDLPRGYKSGEPNMWDVAGAVEIGKRLMQTIDEALPKAQEVIKTNVPFNHEIKQITVPVRRYTEEEFCDAEKTATEILSREPKDTASVNTAWHRFLTEMHNNEKTQEFGPWDNKNSDFGILKPCQMVMDLYRNQDKKPNWPVELHVIRLGDIAIATNPFELYTDFGAQILGRSKASQTFLVQLCAGDYGDYVPTERAVKGKGYSAYNTPVGPVGGQALVEETIKTINELWK